MIEDEFNDVDVINIERIFPDTVKVNYVRIKEYAYVTVGSMDYYVSNTGKVLSIDAGSSEKEGASIRILTNELATSLDVGSYLFGENSETANYLYNVTNLLERMGFRVVESFIKEINFNHLQVDTLKIETRAGAGIEIYFPDVDFETKFRAVISAFNSGNDEKRSSGIWKVANNNVVTYSSN